MEGLEFVMGNRDPCGGTGRRTGGWSRAGSRIEVRVGGLRVFPLVESAGERRVTLGSEVLAKWGGSLQYLGVDFGELVQGGNVANEPDLIGIQEHDFSSVCVGLR